MALSMIASRKAAPLAALIRKLALNDARALQAASVQATRSFSTNAMSDVDSSDDELDLDSRSGRRDAWMRGWKIRRGDFPSGVDIPSWSLYWDEDENRLELRADMPGLGKEHVKVRVVQNMLIIKGEGEKEEGNKDGVRRYGSRIEFTDSDRYKMDEMEAEMKNGILKIVVPKVKEEEKDAFQINVK